MRKFLSTKRILIILVILLGLLFFAYILPYYSFIKKELDVSLLKTIFSFNTFKKVDSQINILLLGIPGPPHDGPNLSDSILLLNYNFKKNRIIAINIPRDVWSNTLQDRINAAYAYGQAKKRGGGLTLAQAEVSAITGTPIQYTVVINFAGFQKLIDFFGGVDIAVDRSFEDKKYPIAGKENATCSDNEEDTSCRYQTIRFARGNVHMDGATALKYVRSRNAIGTEGSDFARGKRQEKVFEAIKNKMIVILLSINIDKTRDLHKIFDEILTRNITNQQIAVLVRDIVLKGKFYTKTFTLTNTLFEVPPAYLYDGKYVLIPKNGFRELHTKIACILEKEDSHICGL